MSVGRAQRRARLGGHRIAALDLPPQSAVLRFGNGLPKLLLPKEDDAQRAEKDLHVQPEGDVHRVIGVVILAVVQVEIAVAAHLPQAGQPRAQRELDHFPILVVAVEHGQQRPRADDAHVPPEDVEQLREFVDLQLADDAPDFGHVRVFVPDHAAVLVVAHPRAGHGTEFVTVELLPARARALLPEDDLSPVLRLDRDRHEQQQGREHDHAEQRGAKIKGIFENPIPTMHGALSRSARPQAARILSPAL